MLQPTSAAAPVRNAPNTDEWLFGWDPTPGIVSVWADRSGRALLWRREGERVICEQQSYRPWLFAATLDDLAHLGAALAEAGTAGAAQARVNYRLLDNPQPGDYRYLLTTRDGRWLENAIVHGAAQRHDRPIRNLYDLEESYYQVGPVEQYLMQTGRVFFRGLAYADVHRLQFDLETSALSPQNGRIFLVAVRDSHGFETVLEAPTAADEAALIADLCALIRQRNPDVVENHNLFGFDLPFLHERARVLGVPLKLGRSEGPVTLERYGEPGRNRRRRGTRFSVAGRELIDTLEAVWRHDFVARVLPGYGLKAVAKYFGVAAPERTYIAGKEIWPTYQRDPAMVRRYALDDVREVDALSQRLLGAPFALAAMAPRRYERVASAGAAMGILEPMLVRAYLRAGAALPRSQNATGDVGHAGGAAWLFAAGVAEHVVKADVASMYPSIMRVFGVGPACDRLGVLLSLVDRLTDLRLQHKAAARSAAPGSSAAHGHDAMQAAMKLLINSAYGYMGAGVMALFADRNAADEITARGRAILGQVTDELKARGMELLEADTDGVFFAAPGDWDEAQERALVAEVAALLPAGLRLEYEGRFKSMLSHEVKNYALLTYGGDLIVRGVAFRSSRSEIFGIRFLHAAIRCTLLGDVAGLQQVYYDTVAALREHRIPASDLATRARLTKAPEDYDGSRGRLRESPYEALLDAGRTTWEAGEWVRFYRGRTGRAILLPDEGGAPPEESAPGLAAGEEGGVASTDDDEPRNERGERTDYDVEHYINVLRVSYVSRLRKAFPAADFDQLFRANGQLGLFDRPVPQIQPLWIRANAQPEESVQHRE